MYGHEQWVSVWGLWTCNCLNRGELFAYFPPRKHDSGGSEGRVSSRVILLLALKGRVDVFVEGWRCEGGREGKKGVVAKEDWKGKTHMWIEKERGMQRKEGRVGKVR